MMAAALTAVLASSVWIGVVHVHHAPSHDARAPFAEVLAAAHAAKLDFLVITDHAALGSAGPLPAAEWSGSYEDASGHRVLVLVGVELGTDDGHLLALDLETMPEPEDHSGRAVIAAIHAQGGFAVVPHPFSHGGWHDWDAPFDGLEVHNNASALRALGLRLPLLVLFARFAPRQALRAMLTRDDRALAKWDELLARRFVVGLSGADAHQNVRVLGRQLDPYAQMFEAVQMRCEAPELEVSAIWAALRTGDCDIYYAIHADRAGEASAVRFPSGRTELQLDGGATVLEIASPPGGGRFQGGEGP